MELVQEFAVERPLRQVWAFFQDMVEVAKCLPGAEVTEISDDGSCAGKLQVKLGPMAVTFEGDAVVAVDEAAHTGTIEGAGADRRGGSRGKIKVHYVLTEAGEGTLVSVQSEIHIAGPAAQFGRPGLLREMSERLIEDFVAHLEAKLDAPDAEAAAVIESGPPAGGALLLSSLWAVFVRFLRRLLGRGRGAA